MQDDPFEQLLRSHRRLEERLEDMSRAAADLGTPKQDEALTFLETSMAWMDRAVTRHEQDEETSLFPRLVTHAGLAECLKTLTAEHRRQEELKEQLRRELRQPGRAALLVRELHQAYARHIKEEEDVLFPAARRLLDAAALSALAMEMANRRGR